jgi:hypothetical protein
MRTSRRLVSRMLVLVALATGLVAAVAAPAAANVPLCTGYFNDSTHVTGSVICSTARDWEIHVTCSDGLTYISYPIASGYAYLNCAGHGTILRAQAWIWYNTARTAPIDVPLS